MRAFPAFIAVAVFAAGCAAPGQDAEEACVPLAMTPAELTLQAAVDAVLRVEASNCTEESITLVTGPCGIDLLPQVTHEGVTYVLADGGALERAHFPCTSVQNATTTLAPGKTARISARWNGTLDVTRCAPPCEATEFRAVPDGVYAVTARALNATATSQVEVRR